MLHVGTDFYELACMPSQWITCGRLTWAFSRDVGIFADLLSVQS